MTIDNSQKYSIAAAFSKFIHHESTRRSCLQVLAESISFADMVRPDRWGLTFAKDSDFVRLNVGMIEVLAVFPDTMHCVLDLGTMPSRLRRDSRIVLHKNKNNPSNGIYQSVPGSAWFNASPANFVALLPVIQDSHRILIDHAAATRRNPVTRRHHSRELIWYLASYLKRDIPQPSYVT